MYGCLIDASKALDTVDHNIVFDELLTRELLSPVIHFLFGWYQSQCLQYKVECMVIYLSLSKCLVVYNKVPILFTLYLDDLLMELSCTNVGGCYWDDSFVGALAYADDITLLVSTPALRLFVDPLGLIPVLIRFSV